MHTTLIKSEENNNSFIEPEVFEDKATVADIVVDHLINEGITRVFGIPGGATIPFHISLEKKQGIEFVLTCHEGGAAFMADCFARVSGNIGVCCATTGPGATNLMTGVAAAYMDSVPLLVITGMNPTDAWGRGDFQESTPYAGVDTTDMFRSICKLSEIVVSEKHLQYRLRNAIATARSGRPGPVHLAIPRDLWGRKITPEIWPRKLYSTLPPTAQESTTRSIAKKLIQARKPLIIFGSGASRTAVERIMDISREFMIPVISTPRAKGKGISKVPETYLGNMGISATPMVSTLLKENDFDLVLTIGAGFGSYATNSWDPVITSRDMTIQVNIDPSAIGRIFPANMGVVAEAEAFVNRLLLLMYKVEGPNQTVPRAKWLAKYRSDEKWSFPPEPIYPLRHAPSPIEIIRAVDKVVGENGIIVSDANSILLWATHYLPERPHRRFISVWGAASMGHATAGVIGAKIAQPEADTVAIIGDGCFLMNGNEIATAVSLQLNIVWIINANQQLGMIHYELRQDGHTENSTLGKYNFSDYAKSLGAHGEICGDVSELSDLISQGLARSGPTIIQVNVDPDALPPLGLKKEGSKQWKQYIEAI